MSRLCPAFCRVDHNDEETGTVTEDGRTVHIRYVSHMWMREIRHTLRRFVPYRGDLEVFVEQTDETDERGDVVGEALVCVEHTITDEEGRFKASAELKLTGPEARELAAALVRAADVAAEYQA